MARLMRAFDWSRTPLGLPATWPQSLRVAVSLCLTSRYPMFVWWGRRLTNLYNDAYAPMLGKRHPDALGRSAAEVWSDVWPVVGPQTEAVLNEGRATWNEELLLIMERNDFTEEAYFTFSYSPVPDEEGGVGGVFCAVTEDTQRVLSQRRLRTLRALAEQAAEAKSAEGACKIAAATLAENPHDLPFALLYLLDGDGRRARLAGLTGLGRDTPTSPAALDLECGDAPWPFRQVAETGKAVEVRDLPKKFGPLPGAAWPESPQQAVVLPIAKSGQTQLAGFVVAGVSPRLAFTDDYEGFMDLLAGHIATAVVNARAYEEERRRAEALEELDRAKTAFFSNVSHEFRTPLTLMLGPLEELKNEFGRAASSLSVPQYQQIDLVHRSGLRLLKLVNTLLDFSRIEAGRTQAVYEETDLASYTAELASVFRSAVEKAGLKLVIDCPRLPKPAYVDREMWEKIVLNLVSNAFKYTFKGEIEVSLKPSLSPLAGEACPEPVERGQGEGVILSVRDTGTGIPEDQAQKVFERFHRVPSARGRTHEGTGIGLALVQELARMHGGSVSVESVYGKGSTFRVFVPLGKIHLPHDQIGAAHRQVSTALGAAPFVEEALRWLPEEKDEGGRMKTEEAVEMAVHPSSFTPSSSDSPSSSILDPARKARIVLADDNGDMREYVRRLLSTRYEVEAVADGEAALAAIKKRAPDLVLSDVMMPRLDGFGLLERLRADPQMKTIPVILVSARAGEESRVGGLQAGTDDYLIKPFSARELVARVETQLKMAALRREDAEARRASEVRLRTALSAAEMGTWRADLRTGMVARDANLNRILGHAAIESTQLIDGYFSNIHPEDKIAAVAAWRRAIETRGVYEIEFRLLRKDGTAQWLKENGRYVRGGNGGPDYMTGVTRDITERKRAEEALRQSERRFTRFMEHLPGLAWTKDLEGRYTYANELAKKIFGKTDEQLYGKTDDEIFPADNAALFKENDRRALTSSAGVQVVETLRHEDGTLHHSLVSKFPIRGEDGAPLAIGGMAIDITERRMAEEALREQQERWKLAAQVGRFGQWQRDLVTNTVQASDECKANFGLAPEDELSYQRIFERIHPDDRDHVRARVHEAITAHRGYEAEYRVIWPDGTTHWINARGSAFYADDGTPLRMIGVTLDITERKQAEEALKQADRRKDEFLATLAHELRNPLAPIRNSLHILRMTGGNAPAAERVHEMMERQVNHMVRLVDDLMEVSRITRGQVELRKERIEFASVIRSAVETAKPAIESAGHQLHITVPPEPVLLEGDPVRLAQVFGNLLNNAAKYTEKSGKIWIDAKLAGENLTVSIRDAGVGIAADMLPRVFDLFMQANQNRAQGGLGIGLSLVRSLVKLHGGSVEAKSEGEGKGSEFIVRLPIAAARLHEFAHTAEYAARPISPRRILVVDDNRDAADSLGMLLRFTGADAHVVYDGRAALEALDIYQPGIVLLDIGMPGMDGIEVARRIRRHPEFKNVTIIALTGWGQEHDRRLTRGAGFDHHLIKPADINALEALLASLESRQSKAGA
ncbi:MAG: ATP-binding protein [Burkholderiales bacterium]